MHIVKCYKGKGTTVGRENYRGLELADHILNIAEGINEKLIRQQVDIDEMQFGFMSGCGTANVELYFAFVALEKVFDEVPRYVVWWALRKLGVEELYS